MNINKKWCAPIATLTLIGSLIGEANAVTIFTDRTAWNTAQGETLTTEAFTSSSRTGDVITTSSGITIEGLNNNPGGSMSVGSGAFQGHLRHPSGGVGWTNYTFTFPTLVTAIGLDLRASGGATDILLTGDYDGTGDQSVGLISQSIIATDDTVGFLGIIGDQAFDSVSFSIDTSGFILLTTEQVDFASVPEPSSCLLFSIASLGLVFRRSRR